MSLKNGVFQFFSYHLKNKIGLPWCEIAKNKSQNLHVPILETTRKNLHPKKKQL